MIFRRLRDRRLDWIYHFPRLRTPIDFSPLFEEDPGPEKRARLVKLLSLRSPWPREEEHKHYDKELAELRESLDGSWQEAIEEALDAPPPTTVRAYEAVFGHSAGMATEASSC